MNKRSLNAVAFVICSIFLSSVSVFGKCLLGPIEYFYTIEDYDSPRFTIESLSLDEETFVELVDKVSQKTHDRAFLIEVPNSRYSENVSKLRAAQFFHYYDFPENNSSFWCRTNGSGIPLAASHTFGARAIVYYKKGSDYFFLLVKDKYGDKLYEAPGGYVQPGDNDIIDAFEKGNYTVANLNYRSPEEAAIDEVLEETGFDLTQYGYGSKGNKNPMTIAQVYIKNTRSNHGIHSVNNCCQYLLFEVSPNEDDIRKQDHEILDVRWASYSEIINDQIDSPIGIPSATDNIKRIIKRVVTADEYRSIKKQLKEINIKLQNLILRNDVDINDLKILMREHLSLEAAKEEMEIELKQIHVQIGKKDITYFTLL